jgi:coproporphyrinogen III oxidase
MKENVSSWFLSLQKQICHALEQFEPSARFNYTPWDRPGGGGGTMSVLHGDVFEKAGVNVSTVHGEFSEQFRSEIPGALDHPQFWASGISLVIHPKNPFVPAIHMNTRFIETSKSWFGGGCDLTPTFIFEDDNQAFHGAFKKACDAFDEHCYEKFKRWCDEYFFLPHRNEPRGIGGIFYDYVTPDDMNKGVEFTHNVGRAFLDIYPKLVNKRYKTPYTHEDKNKQLIKRGRYVEFNLLYDRGTRFGLQTQGNIDAILMSLPPVASWA